MEKFWIGSMVIFLVIICPVFLIYIATHWSFTGILIGWTLISATAFGVFKLVKQPAAQHPPK